MLALYHMVRGGIRVDHIPSLKPIMERAGLQTLPKANVAVLVGTALDPTRKKESGEPSQVYCKHDLG